MLLLQRAEVGGSQSTNGGFSSGRAALVVSITPPLLTSLALSLSAGCWFVSLNISSHLTQRSHWRTANVPPV